MKWITYLHSGNSDGHVILRDEVKRYNRSQQAYSESAPLSDPLDFAHPGSGVGFTAVEHFAKLPNLRESSRSANEGLSCKMCRALGRQEVNTTSLTKKRL